MGYPEWKNALWTVHSSTSRGHFFARDKPVARTARNLPVVDCFWINIMLPQPVFSKFFPLCSFHPMVTVGIDGEASSGEEFAPDFYISWLQQVNQVIHDDIYAVFMEVTVIAEAEEVKFQGFAFYHEISGNVGDVDGGKIGLPCLRAQAGEFGAVEFDEIVTVLVLVGNSFQIVGVIIVFVAGVLIAQEGQLIQSFSFFHGLSPLQHIFKQLAVFRGIEFSGGGNGGGYGPRLFNAPGGHAQSL